MNLHPILRATGLFLIAFGVGFGVLVLLADEDREEPRRGIRIEETSGPPGGASVTRFDGIPTLLSTESPQYSRFLPFTFPSGDGAATETVKILTWHLACDRIDMMEERAVGVRFRIFPEPTDLAQARELAATTPVAAVEITAGEARMTRFFRTPEGESEPQEDWILKLASGVSVLSRDGGGEARLEADDLDCYATEQRVLSRGRIAVTAREYRITGRGLQGDASLGTFTVHEDVAVTIPTSALLDDPGQAAGSTTTIRCPGPLLVERLGGPDDEGSVPTRVTFSNGVIVEQDDAEGRLTAELRAGELRIELLVTEGEEGGDPVVSVKELTARGEVLLTQGGDSSARADALTLVRLPTGIRIRLVGPAEVRHEGAMPGSTEEVPEVEILTIRSGEGAVIDRIEAAGLTTAVFSGGVTASRADREGTTLLTLTSKTLDFSSQPEKGQRMSAVGEARLVTPTLLGTADEIVWAKPAPGHEEVSLRGSPHVEAKAGASFDPFGKTPPEGDAKVHLDCGGDMDLVTKGTKRTFTMSGGATIRKLAGEVELFRVESREITADLQGEEISSLVARHGVVAEGRGEGEMAGDYFASGDSFTFTAAESEAVLSGQPAIARLVEGEGQSNEIRAERVVFGKKDGRFVAENGVQAVVFLRSEGGKRVRPFALKCARLTVTPTSEDDAGGGIMGQIKSLVAEGDTILRSQSREARGDRLTYGEIGPNQILLRGEPALVIERVRIAGHDYENSLQAAELRITLEDEELKRAAAPNGGTITMHRPFAGDSPSLLGSSGSGPGDAAVERLNVSCEGMLTYGARHGVMKTRGRIEQWQGRGDDFKLVARILADTIEVKLRLLPDGTDQLVSAGGKGTVRITGDGWKARCESFLIEFVRHRITVEGTPAFVTQKGGSEQRFVRAVYDYERDTWVELFRAQR